MQTIAPVAGTGSHAAAVPWLVIIAASAGGIQALRAVLPGLSPQLPVTVVIVLHRPPGREEKLQPLLQAWTPMPLVVAESGQRLNAGTVYLARAGDHLTITGDRAFQYVDGRRIKFLRSSANPLLESAAAAFGAHLIAVVLSGTGSDATDGVQTVKTHGGIVIAQDRSTSEHWGMPEAAVRSGAVDYLLPISEIGPRVDALVRGSVVI
jgi:two-component system chemotaxis response regulator CheB